MSYLVSAACARLKCPGVAKNVLMQLADIANDEGFAWPSIETLCMRTDWSRTAVIGGIAWLEANGAILADRSNGRHTVYWVTPRAFKGELHPEPRPQNITASRARGLFDPAGKMSTNQYASRTGPRAVPVREPYPTSTPAVPDQYASRTLTPRNPKEPEKTPQPPAVPAVGARGGAADPGGEVDAAAGFEAVAAIYPKRAKVEAARRVWVELSPSPALQVQILQAVKAWAASAEWQREGGRYIPKLSGFLRDQRWLDAPGTGTPAPSVPPPVLAAPLTPEQMKAGKAKAVELATLARRQLRQKAVAA